MQARVVAGTGAHLPPRQCHAVPGSSVSRHHRRRHCTSHGSCLPSVTVATHNIHSCAWHAASAAASPAAAATLPSRAASSNHTHPRRLYVVTSATSSATAVSSSGTSDGDGVAGGSGRAHAEQSSGSTCGRSGRGRGARGRTREDWGPSVRGGGHGSWSAGGTRRSDVIDSSSGSGNIGGRSDMDGSTSSLEQGQPTRGTSSSHSSRDDSRQTGRGPGDGAGWGSGRGDSAARGRGRGGSSAGRRGRGGSGRQGRNSTGGHGRGRGGSGRSLAQDPRDDLNSHTTLPALEEAVGSRVQAWVEVKATTTMRAAFNFAATKLGMHPGEGPNAADREQTALRHRILTTLAEAYLPLVPQLPKPADCSIPLLALAQTGYCSGGSGEDLAGALLGRLVGKLLPAASCQELSNALYALGKLREECDSTPDPNHLQSLVGEIRSRLVAADGHDFIPQHMSNMLWSCAKLGYADPTLLHALGAAAEAVAGRMEAQGLANSLWALAVLDCRGSGYRPATILLQVHQRLGRSPGEFTPQALSNVLWALAELQLGGVDALVAAAAEECYRRRFVGFGPQEFSNTAWALAKLGHTDQGWFEAMVEASMRWEVMAGATPQAWSNLLYALALVRHQPPLALLKGVVAVFGRSKPQECANTLWALAVLRLYDQQLVDVLAEQLGEQPEQRGREQLTGQGLANSLWALAVLDLEGQGVLGRHCGLVGQLLREAVRRWEEAGGVGGTTFKKEGLVQLWQTRQVLDRLDHNRPASLLDVSPGLLGAMRQAVEEQQGDITGSDLQGGVAAAFERIGRQQQPSSTAAGPVIMSVGEEVVVEGLCGRVDVVLELEGGRRVAVEVDGPSHFLANRQGEVVGSTALRNWLLLRVFGEGNAVSVPFWEWNELGYNGRRQEDYLRCRLGSNG